MVSAKTTRYGIGDYELFHWIFLYLRLLCPFIFWIFFMKMMEISEDMMKIKRGEKVHATCSYPVSPHFLENDIRVKPDLDALGTLGDTGWYCVRAILWAANYELPKTAKALHKPKYNKAGVILSCEASLLWEDNRVATFFCSFLSDMSVDITAIGTKGSLRVHDYVIPNEENEALFRTSSNSYFVELSTGWNPKPSEFIIKSDIPQEALMVKEFANLVGGIKFGDSKADNKWGIISRKTQVVIDAVKASIDNDLESVLIQY